MFAVSVYLSRAAMYVCAAQTWCVYPFSPPLFTADSVSCALEQTRRPWLRLTWSLQAFDAAVKMDGCVPLSYSRPKKCPKYIKLWDLKTRRVCLRKTSTPSPSPPLTVVDHRPVIMQGGFFFKDFKKQWLTKTTDGPLYELWILLPSVFCYLSCLICS